MHTLDFIEWNKHRHFSKLPVTTNISKKPEMKYSSSQHCLFGGFQLPILRYPFLQQPPATRFHDVAS
jgi:hypothetical protein